MMTESEINIMIAEADAALSHGYKIGADASAIAEVLAYRRLLIDWLIGVQLKNFDRG